MASRLTEKDEQGNWCLKGVAWVDLTPGAAITQEVYEKLYGALFKLKDYEDTGLSPDEVIDNQPVVYDMGKIISQIKDIGNGFCCSVGCDNNCQCCAHGSIMRAIIDVVKKGLVE